MYSFVLLINKTFNLKENYKTLIATFLMTNIYFVALNTTYLILLLNIAIMYFYNNKNNLFYIFISYIIYISLLIFLLDNVNVINKYISVILVVGIVYVLIRYYFDKTLILKNKLIFNANVEINLNENKYDFNVLLDSGNLLTYKGYSVMFVNNEKFTGSIDIEYKVVGGMKSIKGEIYECIINYDNKIIKKDIIVCYDKYLINDGILGTIALKLT